MRQHSNSGLNLQGKIIVLWATFLLGMLFHTQLALMPLFHGIDVTQSHTHEYLELSVNAGFFFAAHVSNDSHSLYSVTAISKASPWANPIFYCL